MEDTNKRRIMARETMAMMNKFEREHPELSLEGELTLDND
jgi:hypothetical protein